MNPFLTGMILFCFMAVALEFDWKEITEFYIATGKKLYYYKASLLQPDSKYHSFICFAHLLIILTMEGVMILGPFLFETSLLDEYM